MTVFSVNGGRWLDSPGLLLPNGGDVERHVHLVANEHIAAAKRLIEPHVEIAALEDSDDLDPGPFVARGVDVGALNHG
jgi:hypothetical protein